MAMVFDTTRALARGLEVLRLEAEALQELAAQLGPSFAQACDAILACEGRVVAVANELVKADQDLIIREVLI